MHLSVQPSNPPASSAAFQTIATNLLPAIASYLTINEMNNLAKLTKMFANTLLGGHEQFMESCLIEKKYLSLFVFSPYSAFSFISRTLISRNSLTNPLTNHEYTIWQNHNFLFVYKSRHYKDVDQSRLIHLKTINRVNTYFRSKIFYRDWRRGVHDPNGRVHYL